MIENKYNTEDLPKWSDAKLQANIESAESRRQDAGVRTGKNAELCLRLATYSASRERRMSM
jgi:hypothetical protein